MFRFCGILYTAFVAFVPLFCLSALASKMPVARASSRGERSRRSVEGCGLKNTRLSAATGCFSFTSAQPFYSASSELVQEDVVQSMQEGQTIKHQVYGLGIVTASDPERTSVDFDDHGPKLFVTSMMTAELIGEAPATPPKTKRRRKASTVAKAAKKAAAAAAVAVAKS
jgi:hypothetical protein